jgi:glucoamylase
LLDGFQAALSKYVQAWQGWRQGLFSLDVEGAEETGQKLYPFSATVLRVHEAKHFPGGLIASLSIPWGFAKGDDDLGGYHLVLCQGSIDG